MSTNSAGCYTTLRLAVRATTTVVDGCETLKLEVCTSLIVREPIPRPSGVFYSLVLRPSEVFFSVTLSTVHNTLHIYYVAHYTVSEHRTPGHSPRSGHCRTVETALLPAWPRHYLGHSRFLEMLVILT